MEGVALSDRLERHEQRSNNLGCNELLIDFILSCQVHLAQIKLSTLQFAILLPLEQLLIQLITLFLKFLNVVVKLVLVEAQAILHFSQISYFILVVK